MECRRKVSISSHRGKSMGGKPTYQELERKIKEFEKKNAACSQIEELLHESEERFRAVYEKTPIGYQSLDEQGCFIDVNQAWLDMLDFTREEVIGRNFGEFLQPELRERFKENFPRFMAVGEMLGLECEMVRRDGSVITVFFNGTTSRDEKGHIRQSHCFLYNITERKRSEEEKEKLSDALQKAHAEIEILQGMIPICSSCKKPRADEGFRKKVEKYIQEKTEAVLQHCLCPVCQKQNSEPHKPD